MFQGTGIMVSDFVKGAVMTKALLGGDCVGQKISDGAKTRLGAVINTLKILHR